MKVTINSTPLPFIWFLEQPKDIGDAKLPPLSLRHEARFGVAKKTAESNLFTPFSEQSIAPPIGAITPVIRARLGNHPRGWGRSSWWRASALVRWRQSMRPFTWHCGRWGVVLLGGWDLIFTKLVVRITSILLPWSSAIWAELFWECRPLINKPAPRSNKVTRSSGHSKILQFWSPPY